MPWRDQFDLRYYVQIYNIKGTQKRIEIYAPNAERYEKGEEELRGG